MFRPVQLDSIDVFIVDVLPDSRAYVLGQENNCTPPVGVTVQEIGEQLSLQNLRPSGQNGGSTPLRELPQGQVRRSMMLIIQVPNSTVAAGRRLATNAPD
jgi:hypothetical protein